jgi:hypothetical protein
LEASAFVAGPDYIGFDSADHRQANDDPVTAVKPVSIIDHKAMRREVADMQMQIAIRKMLNDSREIDGVTRSASQVCHA